LIERTPEPEQLPRQNQLPTPAATPVPSYSPSLAPTWKEFEDLTFTKVRGLASKQYVSFDKLSADEIEMLARKKHAEETAHINDGDALGSSVLNIPKTFEDLTFSQVRSLAKKQYKSFDELNVDEVEGLARQGHSEAMVRANNREPSYYISLRRVTNAGIRHHTKQLFRGQQMKETAQESERSLSKSKMQMRTSFSYQRRRRESETTTVPTDTENRSEKKAPIARLNDERQ
jgi:hypothetical protein